MTDESHNGSPRQRRRRLRESFDHQKEEQLDAARDERERQRARQPVTGPRWTIWPRAWSWWQRAFATLVLVLAVVCVAMALGIWLEVISFHLGRRG